MKIVWKSKLPIDKNISVATWDFYKNLFLFGAGGDELVAFYSSMDTASKPPFDCFVNAAIVKKENGEIRRCGFKLKKDASPTIPAQWKAVRHGFEIELDTCRYYAPDDDKDDRRLLRLNSKCTETARSFKLRAVVFLFRRFLQIVCVLNGFSAVYRRARVTAVGVVAILKPARFGFFIL